MARNYLELEVIKPIFDIESFRPLRTVSLPPHYDFDDSFALSPSQDALTDEIHALFPYRRQVRTSTFFSKLLLSMRSGPRLDAVLAAKFVDKQ